jgi:aerotaxis receptor
MPNEVKLQKNTMIVSETDERGVILYANSDFCKIAGYSKDELIGKEHNCVRHDDMPKAAFQDLWETIKQDNIWNGIVKNKTKDGGFYWVNATVFTSVDSHGQKRYISVRVQPTNDEINSAIELYKTLA